MIEDSNFVIIIIIIIIIIVIIIIILNTFEIFDTFFDFQTQIKDSINLSRTQSILPFKLPFEVLLIYIMECLFITRSSTEISIEKLVQSTIEIGTIELLKGTLCSL